jgi:hypothetical protein
MHFLLVLMPELISLKSSPAIFAPGPQFLRQSELWHGGLNLLKSCQCFARVAASMGAIYLEPGT